MTKLFIEQSLASPGSAKKLLHRLFLLLLLLQAYTSACAAGCSSSSLFTDTISQLNSTVFSACSCTPSTSTSLVQGFCPVDCSASLYYFMAVTFVLAFIMCLGRVGAES